MTTLRAVLGLRHRSDHLLMAGFLAVFVVGIVNAIWLSFSF
jgi:hypothetical protein